MITKILPLALLVSIFYIGSFYSSRNLSKKLDEIQNNEKLEQKKQIEFSEKIDELNQETDTLLEEIDKWQM